MGELISAAALIRVNTLLSGIAMVLSSALKKAPHFWRKKLIGAAALIRVNSAHFLMHLTFTNKLLVNGKVTAFF